MVLLPAAAMTIITRLMFGFHIAFKADIRPSTVSVPSSFRLDIISLLICCAGTLTLVGKQFVRAAVSYDLTRNCILSVLLSFALILTLYFLTRANWTKILTLSVPVILIVGLGLDCVVYATKYSLRLPKLNSLGQNFDVAICLIGLVFLSAVITSGLGYRLLIDRKRSWQSAMRHVLKACAIALTFTFFLVSIFKPYVQQQEELNDLNLLRDYRIANFSVLQKSWGHERSKYMEYGWPLIFKAEKVVSEKDAVDQQNESVKKTIPIAFNFLPLTFDLLFVIIAVVLFGIALFWSGASSEQPAITSSFNRRKSQWLRILMLAGVLYLCFIIGIVANIERRFYFVPQSNANFKYVSSSHSNVQYFAEAILPWTPRNGLVSAVVEQPTPDQLDKICNTTTLRSLTLLGGELTKSQTAALVENRSLKALVLDGTKIDGVQYRKLLALNSLEFFAIKALGPHQFQFGVDTLGWETLQAVNVRIDPKDVAAITESNMLKTIIFENVKIDASELDKIMLTESLRELELVTLDTNKDWSDLKCSPYLEQLTIKLPAESSALNILEASSLLVMSVNCQSPRFELTCGHSEMLKVISIESLGANVDILTVKTPILHSIVVNSSDSDSRRSPTNVSAIINSNVETVIFDLHDSNLAKLEMQGDNRFAWFIRTGSSDNSLATNIDSFSGTVFDGPICVDSGSEPLIAKDAANVLAEPRIGRIVVLDPQGLESFLDQLQRLLADSSRIVEVFVSPKSEAEFDRLALKYSDRIDLKWLTTKFIFSGTSD